MPTPNLLGDEVEYTVEDLLRIIKTEYDAGRIVAVSSIFHDKKSRFPLESGDHKLVGKHAYMASSTSRCETAESDD